VLTSRWKTVNASASVYWPGQAGKPRVQFRCCQPHCPHHATGRGVTPLSPRSTTRSKSCPPDTSSNARRMSLSVSNTSWKCTRCGWGYSLSTRRIPTSRRVVSILLWLVTYETLQMILIATGLPVFIAAPAHTVAGRAQRETQGRTSRAHGARCHHQRTPTCAPDIPSPRTPASSTV
jgi:hypothetical protein